jgi:hypothetical protein
MSQYTVGALSIRSSSVVFNLFRDPLPPLFSLPRVSLFLWLFYWSPISASLLFDVWLASLRSYLFYIESVSDLPSFQGWHILLQPYWTYILDSFSWDWTPVFLSLPFLLSFFFFVDIDNKRKKKQRKAQRKSKIQYTHEQLYISIYITIPQDSTGNEKHRIAAL